jgi:hypothetical protein
MKAGMTFCPQCGAGLEGAQATCPACGAEVSQPSRDALLDDALNLAVVVGAMVFAATNALIMLVVASTKNIGNIPTIMTIGILLSRVAVGLAVAAYARRLGRSHPALLGVLALIPVADIAITASLLLETRSRVARAS